MILTPPQKIIAADNHRFRVVNCGRRFGKTILSAEEILGVAVSQDDMVIPYIAPTFTQARDIAWRHFVRRFKPITVAINESRLEITIKTKNGGQSLVELRSWEAIESLRGQKFPFIVFDEVAMYRNFWEGWQEVIRPALSDYQGGALFTSSPKGFNHFYDLYNLQDDKKINARDEWKSYHYTTYDNPYIPQEEIEAARLSMTEDRFAQEYMGEFRKMEGLVYKEFDRDRHLFDDFTTYNTASNLIGVDFGHTNPAAVLSIHKDHDSNYWVRYEWYKKGKTEEQIVEYAKSAVGNAYYPDPENASAIKRMEEVGLNVREVIKGPGSVGSGINKVRELFKQNRLKIHKDCVNLINELETYRYPDSKEGKNEDENPIKEHDHALDALRYVVMMDYGMVEDFYQEDANMYAASYS